MRASQEEALLRRGLFVLCVGGLRFRLSVDLRAVACACDEVGLCGRQRKRCRTPTWKDG